VRDALGEPVSVLSSFLIQAKYGGEIWVYGPTWDFTELMRGESPLVTRFFSPHYNDLVVIFSHDGYVKNVMRARR
jgi:hypothetical protein